MRLIVNGEAMQVDEPASIDTLLERLDLRSGPCAVEVNQTLVPRRDHAEHRLREGDRIEIVTLVGGG